MYTLIGSAKTRAFRAIWMLEELGLEYTLVPVAPRAQEAESSNPTGKIPVLMVDETPIIDSVAIIQFLADRHGGLTYAAGTLERAQQDSFTQFLCDEIDGALWTNARNTFVNPEDKRSADISEILKWEFERSLRALEMRLGEKEFLMGDKMTVPDIILTHCSGWARGVGFPFDSDVLRAYARRMLERPAYQRAHAIRSPDQAK